MNASRSRCDEPMTESVLSKNPCIVGLYAVAPDLEDTDLLARLVGAALEGGAMLVQYRNKVASDSLRAEQAARLAVLCAKHGRPLIINDHVELALSIRAAGLHVGTDDIGDLEALCALRRRLGSSRILGVSCYCSLDRACEAAVACADYAAFGSIFPSTTKPGAPPAALDVFTEARAIGIALVGIGGITHDNVAALINAGADAAAVISDLFAIHDEASVLARARALTAVFKTR
jgi:thiamine-phosphate pyrophosphorylase